MAELVEMYHEGLDTTYLAPPRAVAHYEERGWRRVTEVEPDFPLPSEDGEIDWESYDDALDSQSDEAFNQEDD